MLYGRIEIWIWPRRSRGRASKAGSMGPPNKSKLEGAVCCETQKNCLPLKGFWSWGEQRQVTFQLLTPLTRSATCWDRSPRAPHISACLLESEALIALYPRPPLQGCPRETVSLRNKGRACWLPVTKDSGVVASICNPAWGLLSDPSWSPRWSKEDQEVRLALSDWHVKIKRNWQKSGGINNGVHRRFKCQILMINRHWSWQQQENETCAAQWLLEVSGMRHQKAGSAADVQQFSLHRDYS